MRKLWLVVLAVAPAFMPGCNCSSNNPCIPDPNSSGACPPIEGTWTMTYGSETDSNGCQGKMVAPAETPPPSLPLTRMGADLRASFMGIDLQGQVFDDFQFTLHGNTGTDIDTDGGALVGHEIDFNVRGRFSPGATDAGATISGTWETTNVDEDCDRQSSFNGTRP